MLVEIAKPIALVLSILSLYAVFHTAFLVPGRTVDDRLWDAIALLALAACIALVAGLIFREDERTVRGGQRLTNRPKPETARTSMDTLQVHPAAEPGLTATLPVRLFLWTTVGMALLFFASWYLETHCIFYRDVRF